MNIHNQISSSGGREVSATVQHFAYMDRIAEENFDEDGLIKQQLLDYQSSLQPVRPDEIIVIEDVSVSVFTGESELELCRREEMVEMIMRGEKL